MKLKNFKEERKVHINIIIKLGKDLFNICIKIFLASISN